MISGPDLGGGFLHQLSFSSGESNPPEFVHHIQDGGQDAGGPPLGDPGPFGFERFPGMCQYGGNVCWHRSFALGDVSAAAVRNAYNRWRFVSAVLLEQEYRGRAAPVSSTLTELVCRVGARHERRTTRWYVGASTALWCRGLAVEPYRVQVGTTPEGVSEIAHALADSLVEVAAPTTWPTMGAVTGARAFVGTLTEGMLVEWCAPAEGAERRGSSREWTDAVPLEWRRVDSVEVPIGPVEYALVRAAEQGDRALAGRIASWLGANGFDRDRLAGLFGDCTVPANLRDVVEGLLGRDQGG